LSSIKGALEKKSSFYFNAQFRRDLNQIEGESMVKLVAVTDYIIYDLFLESRLLGKMDL
jgi:hypothetical protein